MSADRAIDSGAAVQVHTATATRRVVAERLAATGTLVGARESDLSPLVAGRVETVAVEMGDRVDAGAPIATLDAADYRAQSRAARATLAEARARASGPAEDLPEVDAARLALEMARRDVARDERLVRAGAISEEAAERSRTAVEMAQARYDAALAQGHSALSAVAAAEASLARANIALQHTTLRAPFAGEIATRNVDEGEYVTPQTKVVHLVEIDPLRVRLAIPQEDVTLVHPGQSVTFYVDAHPGEAFHGTVKYVSAAVEPTSRVLDVLAELPNPRGTLRPGFFVRAELELARTHEVTIVPRAALVDHGETESVFVVGDDGKVEERVVEIGRRTEDGVEIERGVKPGERVVIDRPERLRDGMTVSA